MEWINGFFVPLIKIIFIGGFIGGAGFFVVKGFHNAWVKSWKFIWKYQFKKEKYPENILMFVMETLDRDIDYYEIKKAMIMKGISMNIINETLWIYDRVDFELNKQKGGKKENGRKFKRSNRQSDVTKTEFPKF